MAENIKAIILAAGESARLKKYTRHLPKGMLKFAGKSLIKRQIDLFHKMGIRKIVIVKGFAHDKIDFTGVTYYTNHNFSNTNMLASLFCAEEELEGAVIVSYADILFEAGLLKKLLKSEHDIGVCVDTNWQKYWNIRYGSAGVDAESLKLDDNLIISLGKENPPPEEIDARYIGLIKFSATGIEQLKKVWHKFKDNFWDKPWQVSGNTMSKAFMTDMIQAVIDDGYPVHALKANNGWIEFDSNEDYEKAIKWHSNGMLNSIINIDA